MIFKLGFPIKIKLNILFAKYTCHCLAIREYIVLL